MNNDFESAQQALLNAQQAVRQGDRQTARRFAEIAASLSPDLEEPWLILAAVGSPRASVEYLERALRINPQSERARLGMHWAVDRLRRETARGKNAGPPDKPSGGAISQSAPFLETETKPLVGRKRPAGSKISQSDFNIAGGYTSHRREEARRNRRCHSTCTHPATIQISCKVSLVVPDFAGSGGLCDGSLGILAWQCLAGVCLPPRPSVYLSRLWCSGPAG